MKDKSIPSDSSAAQSPRIMLINDDPRPSDPLNDMLSNEGYDIVVYHDPHKALARVNQVAPDLIIIDSAKPGSEAFGVVRQMKAAVTSLGIPIIMVTAACDEALHIKALQNGAVDVFTKPISEGVIKARLASHLALKQTRDPLKSLLEEQTVALVRSQRQFQSLVENSLVGIAIIQEGQVAYQNPELQRTVAHLDQKILDGDFSFVHPEDWPKVKESCDYLIRSDVQSAEADFRIIKENDVPSTQQTTWVNCRAVKFRYRDREAILINATDISRAKELEQLLLLRNKMSSLGRIASGMAHEIRNPMTGITSYLYTLEQLCDRETLLPKDIALMAEIVDQLKLASHKVDSVIKRVLDFAKPTPPQMVPFELNRRLDNVCQLNAVTLRKAGIKVTTRLTPSLPQCYGDVGLLEQVFLNLVQNAAQAVKKSPAAKWIEIGSYVLANWVCAYVADSGSGVPEELKEKIFDPFFTTKSDGSGIGLSIAQRIITDHNGKLTLDNGPLGGARFTVCLPVEKRKRKR